MTDPATFLTEAAPVADQSALYAGLDLELLHNLIINSAIRADRWMYLDPDRTVWLKEAVSLSLIAYVKIANSLLPRQHDPAYPVTVPDLVEHIRVLMAMKGSKYRTEPVAFLDVGYLTAQIVIKAYRARERIDPEETLDELQDIIVYAVKTSPRISAGPKIIRRSWPDSYLGKVPNDPQGNQSFRSGPEMK